MNKITSILFFLFLSLGTFAQDLSSTDSVVKELEQRVVVLESQKELLEQSFENQKDGLSNQFDTYKNQVDVSVNRIDTFFWLIGFVGIFGVISLFWYAGFRAKKEVDKKIDAIFDENSERLRNLIAKESLEVKLRDSSKLLVVYSDDTCKTEVDDFFIQTDFPRSNRTYRHIDKDVPSLKEYDLIIQSIGEDVEDAVIQKYLDIEGQYFVVYVKERKSILLNYRHNTNVANSKFTLYHQIINTLKFKN